MDVIANANRVAAVVVTRDRPDALTETLEAIASQDRPLDLIVIVDSGSAMPATARPECGGAHAVVLRFDENIGPGAGRAEGMRWALQRGFDRVWLVDDDSPPRPRALERLLAADSMLPDAGMVGLRGGTVRAGRIRHDSARMATALHGPPAPRAVDFVLLDGGLVRRSAVDRAGYPRADFFIMMEDVEYPLRLKRAGFGIYVLDEDLIEWGNLGSQPGDLRTAWRGYYQSRNLVRTALDLPMPSLFLGAAMREGRALLTYSTSRSGRARLRLRWRGVVDGFANRMGRVVEPGSVSPEHEV